MLETKLNLKLKLNYENSIREYLKYMTTQGFVLSSDDTTEDTYIVQYNAEKNDFFEICYAHAIFETLISPNIPNPYNINLNWSDILNMIVEILPFATIYELSDFTVYSKYEVEFVAFKELEAELNDFKKLSKTLTKKIDVDNFTSPHEQGTALSSEMVFYTGDADIGHFRDKRSYFKWDKVDKKFKKLSAEDIHEILIKKFKVTPNSITLSDIKKNMRTNFPDIVTNSDLSIRWNNNATAKAKMDSLKKNYEKVEKIVENFQ